MQVLRDNKESLMAVLEAFVYDPLINWRLMQTEVELRRPEGKTFSVFVETYCCLTLSLIEGGEVDPERVAEFARAAGQPQGPMRKLKADENDIFNGATWQCLNKWYNLTNH